MGLILDTSLLVQAERLGQTVPQALQSWSGRLEDAALGISVVSLTELGHGIMRAETEQRRRLRRAFVSSLRASLPVYGVDEEIALRAGMIDGGLAARGYRIGLADVLIAATALERGDGVATLNVKHFAVVPGLDVVEI